MAYKTCIHFDSSPILKLCFEPWWKAKRCLRHWMGQWCGWQHCYEWSPCFVSRCWTVHCTTQLEPRGVQTLASAHVLCLTTSYLCLSILGAFWELRGFQRCWERSGSLEVNLELECHPERGEHRGWVWKLDLWSDKGFPEVQNRGVCRWSRWGWVVNDRNQSWYSNMKISYKTGSLIYKSTGIALVRENGGAMGVMGVRLGINKMQVETQ